MEPADDIPRVKKDLKSHPEKDYSVTHLLGKNKMNQSSAALLEE
jgi:hypothetical protein